jgi:hypothetical protein
MSNQQKSPQQGKPQVRGNVTERKAPNFDNNNNAGKPMPTGKAGGSDNRDPRLTRSDRNGVEPEKPENLGHDPKFDDIQASGQRSAQRGGNQDRT